MYFCCLVLMFQDYKPLIALKEQVLQAKILCTSHYPKVGPAHACSNQLLLTPGSTLEIVNVTKILPFALVVLDRGDANPIPQLRGRLIAIKSKEVLCFFAPKVLIVSTTQVSYYLRGNTLISFFPS